jgi:hypothetical protein
MHYRYHYLLAARSSFVVLTRKQLADLRLHPALVTPSKRTLLDCLSEPRIRSYVQEFREKNGTQLYPSLGCSLLSSRLALRITGRLFLCFFDDSTEQVKTKLYELCKQLETVRNSVDMEQRRPPEVEYVPLLFLPLSPVAFARV